MTPREIELESPAAAAVDISRSIPNYSVTDVGNTAVRLLAQFAASAR